MQLYFSQAVSAGHRKSDVMTMLHKYGDAERAKCGPAKDLQCERVMPPVAVCINLYFVICPLLSFYEDIFKRILIDLFSLFKGQSAENIQ